MISSGCVLGDPGGPGGVPEGFWGALGGVPGVLGVPGGVPGGSWEGLGRVLRGVPGGLGALLGRIGRNPAEYLKVNKNLRQMNDLWGPGGPQMAPKRPHVGPKPPPNRPRWPLRPPKTAQEAPKTAQEGVPEASPTSTVAQGSLRDRSRKQIFPPRAPRWGIKGGITTPRGSLKVAK